MYRRDSAVGVVGWEGALTWGTPTLGNSLYARPSTHEAANPVRASSAMSVPVSELSQRVEEIGAGQSRLEAQMDGMRDQLTGIMRLLLAEGRKLPGT